MTQTPAVGLFIRRLAAHSSLPSEERDVLCALPWQVRPVASRRDLARIGEPQSHCYLVSQGIIGRFQQVADGRRQIQSIHLPGEVVNLDALMVSDTVTGMNALTVSRVEQIPIEFLREVCQRFPSIAEAFCRDLVISAQILAQSVVSIGRRSARARIAHFLCELGERYSRSQGTDWRAFSLPMSQEQIGDTLGLTSVHVNRMMSGLRTDNLISTSGNQVTIIDPVGLAWAGEFEPSYLPESPVAEQSANRARA